MDTTEILNNCRALSGVTVKTYEEYAELELLNGNDFGKMKFIPMFDGVTLAVIEVHAVSWPAPVPNELTSETTGPLIINYCIRGRCELVLNDNKSVFLTSGQIALTEKFAQGQYVYPGGIYEGVELFIDPEAVQNGVGALYENFGIAVEKLSRRYCPNGDTFIAEMPLQEALLKRLYDTSNTNGSITPVNKINMKTGVIELLALLLYNQPLQKREKLVYYTRFQVGIARQIEAVILSDLSRRHTIQEFSKRFSISESSVKNYFYGVFGQSISRYTAHKRMVYAAELLANTDLSVIEISGRVGYESQSKFAAAFCKEYKSAPIEYRRKQKLLSEL